jgi:Cdc6-like AAA superfamily ATPase
MAIAELPADSLRRTCDSVKLGCKTSEEAIPLEAIIGQERAIRSLQFGLGIRQLGFNIFVAGMSGTGRTTAVKRFLEQVARDQPVPSDLCYVNNFADPYRPNALSLPSGRARKLQQGMKGLVDGARRDLRSAFESDEYAAKRDETVRSFEQQRNELFGQLNVRAQQEGFFIQATPVGLLTIPLRNGQPLNEEEFHALSAEEQNAITQKREALQTELKSALRQARGLEKSIREALSALDKQIALYTLSQPIEELKEEFQDLPEVVSYIEATRDDILENLPLFRGQEDQ